MRIVNSDVNEEVGTVHSEQYAHRVGPDLDHPRYDAVIFDMDGVVTDTAAVHAAAWKALFDEALPDLAGSAVPEFDAEQDYRRYVDGRTREDGVRAVLAARGIELPDGDPDDRPEVRSVHGLASRKQELFADQLARGGMTAFPSTVALLRRLRGQGVPTGLVTSSRNSEAVLAAAGVTDLFDVRVDGGDAVRLSLPGKPDPAMFWEAARRLQVEPSRSVVVEDAEAGVRAGASGGFGLVVGVDRTGGRERLLAAGAHVVVDDVAALDLGGSIRQPAACWCGGASAAGGQWRLVYDGFDPAQEGTREALCTLGNGYWGTRGSAPGSVADEVHYPGTYLAGVYNRLSSDVGGRSLEDEHLVNAPDWTSLSVRAGDGPPLAPGSTQMLSHYQELDVRRGVLTRTNRYRDAAGRTTRVTSRQLLSLALPHLAGLETTVEAEDWSGALLLRSAVDGRVANRNVAEYRPLADRHLLGVGATEVDPQTVLLETVTSQSQVHIAVAARTRVRLGSREVDTRRRLLADDPAYAGQELELELVAGRPVTIEKVVAVATSRDRATSTAALAARARISQAPGFADLLDAHEGAWAQLWNRFGVEVRAGRRQCLALNLHTFHVLQTVAAAGPDLDAGVPARGLHGEGYRGHVFWDELFVYPMLTLRRPELTRALLLYRYRRLDQARAAARAAGLGGAMFPWQSGTDGREETPTQLYNRRSGGWMPDNSHRQRHVGLAVAYSIWQYYQATADLAFMAEYGAELIVEVARLFASLATHDPTDDRFDITGVMGPDEFHDGYPGAAGQGLRNNAYTNVMAAWVLTRALETLDLLAGQDRCSRQLRGLEPSREETARWERISRRLRVPFHADGVISQFEGYEGLAEFDWEGYRARYGDLGRLDLILAAEEDSPNNYRLSKQADVLMLFYLLSVDDLREVFDRLGYALPPESVPRTVEYYLARTTHGSTLSRLVHSWVLARGDRHRSWSLFTRALDSDLDDIQGGTTREGVHLGAMAGTVDLVMRCYGGLETRGEMLRLHPALPPELPRAAFDIVYRGQPISVELTRARVLLRLHPCAAAPIQVCVEDQISVLTPGDVHEVARADGSSRGTPATREPGALPRPPEPQQDYRC
jgi:beta-phosphoglucomutase family hydrolase